jgi:hypothetical protein
MDIVAAFIENAAAFVAQGLIPTSVQVVNLLDFRTVGGERHPHRVLLAAIPAHRRVAGTLIRKPLSRR